MATSVTSNKGIYWSNDWNRDTGDFRLLFSVPANIFFLVFLSFFSPHSVFLVSKKMRSALTPNSRCCERMTICLWWKVMIGRPLDCDMRCHFRVSWNSRTVFNLFSPEVWWQKYEERKVVFCRSNTKVSRAMTWLASGADATSSVSLGCTVCSEIQTQWVTQRREWIMQQSIFIH